MTDFDFSELTQLAADLGDVPKNAGPNIRKALTVTSINIKKTWASKLKGSKTLPGLAGAVDFDLANVSVFGVSVIKSDIGFNKSRSQGKLGNISEFGSPTVTPRGFGIAALHENEADFEKGLSIALEQAEKESGL